MNIIFAASEGVPFCKTGGLADVVGSLPASLAEPGHHLKVFLPLYKEVDRSALRKAKVHGRLFLLLSGRGYSFNLWEVPLKPRLTFCLVECDAFFGREGIYGYKKGGDFQDNDLRFIFFSRAVLEGARSLEFKPDIVHAHDWQTGLIPAYLKTAYSTDPFFQSTASVFSIHNMAFQGLFPRTAYAAAGLPDDPRFRNSLRFYNQISFLKAGIVHSDALHTVSPQYKKEISSKPEFGYGLEDVLKKKSNHFAGILNGLDVAYWNPKSDMNLVKNFDVSSLNKRTACKLDLQRCCGFEQNAARPLLGFVGRLEAQKGVDLLLELAWSLIEDGAQLVFLGRGNKNFEDKFKKLHKRYPRQVFMENRFAEPFAHKIYAGSDLFLMPSQFEPCGLGQMIAMRYGALPVVRPTGGLLDTVVDVRRKNATGFVAKDRSGPAFQEAVEAALECLKDPQRRRALQVRGMKTDFSWNRIRSQYLDLYGHAIRWHSKVRSKPL